MSLENCRAEIDVIDDELLVLLNRRAGLVVEAMVEKRRKGLAIRDRHREHVILSRVSGSNPGPMDRRGVITIFSRIISESRRVGAKFAATSSEKPELT